jgi:hypothetical protein
MIEKSKGEKMEITLRELTSFDGLYNEQLEEVVAAALTLAFTMADNDPLIHAKLYESDVGSDEWYQEVTDEALEKLPSADKYWELCEEFITLNTEDGDIDRLMNALGKVGPVLLSLRSFMQAQILKDLEVDTSGEVLQ